MTDKEKRQLHGLGYAYVDIANMDNDHARTLIDGKVYAPGSKKAAQAVAASIGMPGAPERYTNEGIEKFNEGKDLSAYRINVDEYENKLMSGKNVNDEVIKPYVEANPELDFRLMTDRHCKHRGTRGWQPVYDPKTGKKVTVLNENRWVGAKRKTVRQAQLNEYQDKHQKLRQSVKEQMAEATARAERDSGGAIRLLRDGQMIGGMPVGDTTTRGNRVS